MKEIDYDECMYGAKVLDPEFASTSRTMTRDKKAINERLTELAREMDLNEARAHARAEWLHNWILTYCKEKHGTVSP